jgi:hypothetical protein
MSAWLRFGTAWVFVEPTRFFGYGKIINKKQLVGGGEIPASKFAL